MKNIDEKLAIVKFLDVKFYIKGNFNLLETIISKLSNNLC